MVKTQRALIRKEEGCHVRGRREAAALAWAAAALKRRGDGVTPGASSHVRF